MSRISTGAFYTTFLLDEWEDRYRYIIELGRTLAPLPAEAHNDANKVQGCASQVWLTTTVQAEVVDGMSIPEELARREDRLAKLAQARAKIEARATERFAREAAEHRAKLAAREAKAAATGKRCD